MSLGKKALVGSIWSTSVNYLGQGIGFLSQAILGRCLLESDFGIFATVNSFIQFIFMLSAFSFNMSMIQAQEEHEELVPTALILTMALSAVSLLIAGISIGVFSFYRNITTSEMWVFWVLAFVNIANLFGQLFDAVLQRGLEFKKIAFVTIGTGLVNPVVAVVLALQGYGVWSLVYGQVSAAVFFLGGNFLISRWKIRL